MAHIRIEGLEGLMELLGVTEEDLEKDMGPFAKAYEKIIADETPRNTLVRFGLDVKNLREAQPIIDFTTLQAGLNGWKPSQTILSIFMAGVFTGLQLGEDKNES